MRTLVPLRLYRAVNAVVANFCLSGSIRSILLLS